MAKKKELAKKKPVAGASEKLQAASTTQTRVHQGDRAAQLKVTREDLQSSIERLETSNEDLRASNEEVTSMNEELQSATTELESSQQELQSLNEELRTVNTQLEEKVELLEDANSDLSNLLSSSDIAVIYLDPQLKVRRYTPVVTEVFELASDDLGQPLREIVARLHDGQLLDDAQQVLDKLVPIERKIELPAERRSATDEGRSYLRRVSPYRSSESRIEGVVVTYWEVSLLEDARLQLERRERQQAAVAQLGCAALAGLDLQRLFEDTVAVVAATLDNEYCEVLELLPGGKDVLLVAGVGWKEGLVGSATVDTGWNSQAGYMLRSASPVVVEDLPTESRFRGPALLTEHGVVSGMSVIIGAAAQPWGVLGTHSRRRIRFTADDVNFLQGVANVLSTAITHADTDRRVRDWEQRLRLALEAGRMGTWQWDFATGENVWSKREYQLLGLPPVDGGTTVDDFFKHVHPDDLPGLNQAVDGAVHSGESYEHEFRILRADGQLRWLAGRGNVIRDEHGKPLRMIGVNYDITDRKHIEQQLQESLNRLQAVVETAVNGIITVDDRGVIESVNPATERIFGYTAAELVGQYVDMLMPDSHREQHGGFFDNYLRTSEKSAIGIGREVPAQRKDGSVFPIELSVGETSIGNRRVFVGIVRDISERKAAEAALTKSEERFRRSVDAAHAVAYEVSFNDGHVSSVYGMPQLLGESTPEPMSRSWWLDRVHPDDLPSYQSQFVAEDAQGSSGFDLEYRVRHAGGDYIYVRDLGELQRDEQGRAAWQSGVIVDITAQRTAEDELRQLNATLEHRVEERAGVIRLLHDVASACHEADSVEEAIGFVLRAFSRFNGWCFGHAFQRANDNPDELVPFMAYYEQAPGRFERFRELTRRIRLRRGQGLPGRVWEQGDPKIVTDLSAEMVDRRVDLGEELGVRAAAAFPVVIRGEVVAVLEFFSDSHAELDNRVRDAMANVGTQIALVVERRRLKRRIAEIARDEQLRIGQDLHDTVTQQLTGGTMVAAALRQQLENDQSRHAVQAANLVEILKDAQHQVRNLMRGLLPVEVPPENLIDELDELVERTSQLHGVECSFEFEQEIEVRDTVVATHLFRIAQEATHNAVKHAGAGRIVIQLQEDEAIRLSVRDDGEGMYVQEKSGSKRGLRIMQSRAEVIGGILEIQTEPGGGTCIVCTVPRETGKRK
ncbi:MAG: PAS domain S-box protein [Pirellulales bacterium]